MNNFCPQPWVGLDINPQGQVKPCCKYDEFLGDTIDDYFSSNKLEQLKQQFLANQRPPGCKRCWDDEDAGHQSKRLIDLQYTLSSVNLSKLKMLSLPFGNTCNLKCRTCRGESSSRWIADEEKLRTTFPDIQIYKHQKFYKQKQFIDQIYSLSSDLENIIFPGGESFITGVPEQLEYLDFLIGKNAKNITLNYITNCTVFPDSRFWNRWKFFKKVNVQLSIDGIEDKFEYIRYPANWSEVYNNIKSYQKKQNITSNLQLSIGHTVSIFNILDVKDFAIWCIKEGLPKPYYGLVSQPEYFDIRFLPEEIKKAVQTKLISSAFDPLVQYMQSSTNTDPNLTLQWIEAVDSLRNQSFYNVFPEMGDLLFKNKY